MVFPHTLPIALVIPGLLCDGLPKVADRIVKEQRWGQGRAFIFLGPRGDENRGHEVPKSSLHSRRLEIARAGQILTIYGSLCSRTGVVVYSC